MKQKPVVGQTLYAVEICRHGRRLATPELTEANVVKVGRQYFYAKKKDDPEWMSPDQFRLSDWRRVAEYGSGDIEIYETREEWENKQESEKIGDLIHHFFQNGRNIYDVSIQRLRDIKAILDQAKIEHDEEDQRQKSGGK